MQPFTNLTGLKPVVKLARIADCRVQSFLIFQPFLNFSMRLKLGEKPMALGDSPQTRSWWRMAMVKENEDGMYPDIFYTRDDLSTAYNGHWMMGWLAKKDGECSRRLLQRASQSSDKQQKR